jgi:hypothetical protein
MAFLSSKGIASPTWAEKPGCFQARTLRASSCEIAWRSTRRAGMRSRNGFMTKSPAVATETTIPGRQSWPSRHQPTSRWESVRRELKGRLPLDARLGRARESLHRGPVRAGPQADRSASVRIPSA